MNKPSECPESFCRNSPLLDVRYIGRDEVLEYMCPKCGWRIGAYTGQILVGRQTELENLRVQKKWPEQRFRNPTGEREARELPRELRVAVGVAGGHVRYVNNLAREVLPVQPTADWGHYLPDVNAMETRIVYRSGDQRPMPNEFMSYSRWEQAENVWRRAQTLPRGEVYEERVPDGSWEDVAPQQSVRETALISDGEALVSTAHTTASLVTVNEEALPQTSIGRNTDELRRAISYLQEASQASMYTHMFNTPNPNEPTRPETPGDVARRRTAEARRERDREARRTTHRP